MIYTVGDALYNKFKAGDEVWMYCFQRLGGKTGKFHNRPPQFGVFTSSNCYFVDGFIPYKKCGGLAQSKKERLSGLYFCDNEAEAKKHYNELVTESIHYYEEKISKLQEFLV